MKLAEKQEPEESGEIRFDEIMAELERIQNQPRNHYGLTERQVKFIRAAFIDCPAEKRITQSKGVELWNRIFPTLKRSSLVERIRYVRENNIKP